MNLYFLVEGMTEKRVYPLWIRARIPQLTEVKRADQVVHNQFYCFSSGGFPSILQDIAPAVEEIHDIGRYDYLVIVLDADELTREERMQEVQEVFKRQHLTLGQVKLQVTIQNRCFETWCMGNRAFYRQIDQTYKAWKPCQSFYDCHTRDPEQMTRDPNHGRCHTISQYHAHYLKQLFAANQVPYTKGRRAGGIVGTADYLKQLYQRVHETKHQYSLGNFLSFLDQVAKKVQGKV